MDPHGSQRGLAEGKGLGEATTRSGQGSVKVRSDAEASRRKAFLPGGLKARERPAGAAGEGLRVWLEKAKKEHAVWASGRVAGIRQSSSRSPDQCPSASPGLSVPWLSLGVFHLWVINASFERFLLVLCWVWWGRGGRG